MRAILSVLAVALLAASASADTSGAASQGQELRWRTPHGPIHVWTPPGYDATTAATVVFVHGYFASVDDAWDTYQLPHQFQASGLNALFIACEAPQTPRDRVPWTSFDDLMRTVRDHVDVPEGRLVAIGHSAAHRTFAHWLDASDIDTFILLDAAYGDLSPYAEWIKERSDRRLIDVGDVRRAFTDAFHRRLADTVVVDRFPAPSEGALPEEAREASVLYVRAWMGHMQLVTKGIAIPMLLRAVSAPLVGDVAYSSPLDVL